MSRYIDADALMETIRHFVDTMSVCPSTDYCNGLRFMKKQAIEAVENAPTVDAVPVVRCGECGYYHSEDDPAYCDELCTIHIEPTDGCLRGIKRGGNVGYRAADGERKDGEG